MKLALHCKQRGHHGVCKTCGRSVPDKCGLDEEEFEIELVSESDSDLEISIEPEPEVGDDTDEGLDGVDTESVQPAAKRPVRRRRRRG